MRPTLRLLAIAAALAVASCTFGTTSNWVSSANVSDAWHGGLNDAGDLLLVYDGGDHTLKAFDPGVDSVVASHSLWNSTSWYVRDLIADRTDADALVGLHSNGYAVQWHMSGSTLTYGWYQGPRPLGSATSRSYCDLAMDSDGDLFVTSIDTISGVDHAVLARRDGSTGTWTTTTLPGSDFYDVAYDDVNHMVVVQTAGSYTFKKYENDLTYIGQVEVWPNESGDMSNFDVRNGTLLVTAHAWQGRQMLWLFDMSDGSLEDAEQVHTTWIEFAQITSQEGSQAGSVLGVFGGAGPSVPVGAIDLLP